ncbi:TIR domain-containing protein [Vibrio sp. 378]|uniref:TIR domain-containing protein n=1 Tax=Vibrio TaxID=662 RepID=UPI002119F70B|nr:MULTISPECIES: TIR domain-containing protein [Vibrio]MCQ9062404.1 TIR domain-containing protein [Vibrio alginolyticus]MDW2149477.1 TIR domain-containing protein [Vibrio sp. 378]
MNIFISYTLRDDVITVDHLKSISEVVSDYGKPFVDIIDNDAKDKQKFVIEQLDNSDLVVLLNTDSVSKSKWVRLEIDRANKNNTPVISIPLNGNQPISLIYINKYLRAELKKANKRFKTDSQRSAVLV